MDENKPEILRVPEAPVPTPAPTPAPTPTPVTEPLITKLKRWAMIVSAIVLIPLFAWQNMRERLSVKETLVDEAGTVKVVTSRTDFLGEMIYADGTRLPREGYGIAYLTWEDFKKDTSKLDEKVLKEADFPVVVAFNASGFDASGDAITVRRAANGSLIYAATNRTKPARLVIPKRNGDFAVLDADGTERVVSDTVWYRDYVGMSEVKEIKDKPVAPVTPSGVRGRVLRFIGLQQPVGVSVDVIAFRDTLEPVAKIDDADKRIVARTRSADDGKYELLLPPGTYTIVILWNGVPTGNALKQGSWPTVTVPPAQWVDYDFRRQ